MTEGTEGRRPSCFAIWIERRPRHCRFVAGDERDGDGGRVQSEPNTLKRKAAVPKEWEAALDLQEDFIEEFLGDR